MPSTKLAVLSHVRSQRPERFHSAFNRIRYVFWHSPAVSSSMSIFLELVRSTLASKTALLQVMQVGSRVCDAYCPYRVTVYSRRHIQG